MNIASKLRSNGLTATRTRVVLFHLLIENPQGLTAEDIYVLLAGKEKISIGSIYRILVDLENHGLIKRIFYGKNKSIYKSADQRVGINIFDSKTGLSVLFHDENINKKLEKIFEDLPPDIIGLELTLYKQ